MFNSIRSFVAMVVEFFQNLFSAKVTVTTTAAPVAEVEEVVVDVADSAKEAGLEFAADFERKIADIRLVLPELSDKLDIIVGAGDNIVKPDVFAKVAEQCGVPDTQFADSYLPCINMWVLVDAVEDAYCCSKTAECESLLTEIIAVIKETTATVDRSTKTVQETVSFMKDLEVIEAIAEARVSTNH